MRDSATERRRPRHGPGPAAVLPAALACLALLLLTAPAQAATVTDRPLLFSFDGATATAGPFVRFDGFAGKGVSTIAVDDSCARHEPPLSGAACEAFDPAGGAVYVASGNYPSGGFVSKFHPDGSAWDFSFCGCSSLSGFTNSLGVAVDDSGAHPGRIYVSQYGGESSARAFDPGGRLLWTLYPPHQLTDVAVDPAGLPWLLPASGSGLTRYESAGAPPPPGGCTIAAAGGRVSVDGGGNVDRAAGPAAKYTSAGDCAFSGSASFDAGPVRDLDADQSGPAGHVFALHPTGFSEYESCAEGEAGCAGGERLLGAFAQNVIGSGAGIAYDAPLDRVYAGDGNRNVVDVFGPAQTGTAPDPTIEPATEVGIGKASLHGEVNPQGVPNAYFFEYKKGAEAQSGVWERVRRSEEETLPEDGSNHPASATATDLFGDTTYQVRLVAINTANGLRQVSEPATFKTQKATEAPEVTIDPVGAEPAPPCPSGIGGRSACVSGTIDGRGDSVQWWVERSTDPGCETGFKEPAEEEIQYLPAGTGTPQPVHLELGDLLPAQHYCARIAARNSFEAVSSGIEEFTTAPVPPDQVATGFAAPRTDTSARLNGYANPEGAALTYRFEYKRADRSEEFQKLADETYSGGAREEVVLGEELTGLEPATPYSYRLSVENGADAGSPVQGEAKTFTTRTSAEVAQPDSCPNEEARIAQRSAAYLPRCRGIELVNRPDKGNQNPVVQWLAGHGRGTKPFSAGGEDALWLVRAGAPEGSTGTGSIFLSGQAPAESPQGWATQSLLPPAAQLEGEGQTPYTAIAASGDFSRFLLEPGSFSYVPPAGALMRCDRDRHCVSLVRFPAADIEDHVIEAQEVDTSGDLSHVVAIDHSSEPPTLRDFGAGGAGEALSVMPDGTPAECIEGDGKSFVGSGPAGYSWAAALWRPGYQMIATSDASRVYFQTQPNEPGEHTMSCEEENRKQPLGLYERNREADTTTLIDSGVEATPLHDTHARGASPRFIRAAPDGRSAYFTTVTRLDPADANEGFDLYRWDEAKGKSSCLSCGVKNERGEAIEEVGIGLNGAVLVSDDFSHAYFTSPRMLVPDRGAPGARNLYVLHSGTVRFIAQVGPIGQETSAGGTKLTPDGQVLLFESSRPLSADAIAACTELYRYDAGDGSIECVSCLKGGLTSHGVGNGFTGTASSEANLNDVRFDLTDDGDTILFTTTQALLPADINGTAYVYEWHDGILGLITDGATKFKRGAALPALVGADAGGGDVFFTVAEPGLTGFEADGVANLYDARIGGGFVPPPPPQRCTEESCQGPLQAPPPFPSPGSAGFEGQGNLAATAAAGRCGALNRRARAIGHRAIRLRTRARRARKRPRARRLGRRAARLERRSRGLGKRARRCRRAAR
jgi:hypothetical protein